MNARRFRYVSVLLLSIALGTTAHGASVRVRRGAVTNERVRAGEYFQYVPRKRSGKTNVLVICHGSIDPPQTASVVARRFIDRWRRFAEHTGCLLVAPAFDIHNYASDQNAPGGSAWGYRALDGRETPSDEFVHMILDTISQIDAEYDGTFFLYGHSAGGQFANHYLVVHPQRLNGVVLSAPAIYAMPDPDATWPTGMKERRRVLQWGNVEKVFEISHKVETWVQAAQVPLTVVIGTDDIKKLGNQPQQGGWTRVDRARHYVKQMKSFASDHGVSPGVSIVTVPGVGHDSARLTNTAGAEMLSMLQAHRRENPAEQQTSEP